MQCYVQVPTSPPHTVNIRVSGFTAGKSTVATKTGHELICKKDTAETLAFCLQPLNLPVEKQQEKGLVPGFIGTEHPQMRNYKPMQQHSFSSKRKPSSSPYLYK